MIRPSSSQSSFVTNQTRDQRYLAKVTAKAFAGYFCLLKIRLCIFQVSDNGGNVSFLYDLVGSGSQVSSLSRGVAADEMDGGSRQSGTQGVDDEVVDQQLFSSRVSANKEATVTVVTLTDHHQRPRWVDRQKFMKQCKIGKNFGLYRCYFILQSVRNYEQRGDILFRPAAKRLGLK